MKKLTAEQIILYRFPFGFIQYVKKESGFINLFGISIRWERKPRFSTRIGLDKYIKINSYYITLFKRPKTRD